MVTPAPLVRVLLERVRWGDVAAVAGPAADVPQVVERLVTARTFEAAEMAYWGLDNYVVIQQNISPAAVEVTPVLLALLAGEPPSFTQAHVLELLFEIGNNNHIPWTEEQPAHRELRRAADRAVCAGIWLYLQKSRSADPDVRDAAVGMIGLVERLTGQDTGVAESLPAIDDLLAARHWPSNAVPDAVRVLADASSVAAAGECERVLASVDSAALAWVLLALLAGWPPAPSHVATCRLLAAMTSPESRPVVADGLWLYYQGLLSDNGEIRAASIPLLEATEPDRARLSDVLSGM